MRESDLDVHRTGHNMADEQIGDAHFEGKRVEDSSIVGPEKGNPHHFKAPESVAFGFKQEERVRVGVEIESCKGEYDKVEAMSDQHGADAIKLTASRSLPC